MRDVVAEMVSAAAPGQIRLSAQTLARLRHLTAELQQLDASTSDELRRYLDVPGRQLQLRRDAAHRMYAGRRILVTGGTGCIGTALIHELHDLGAGPIVSVSRGRRAAPADTRVQYLHADVSDANAAMRAISASRPDVIFHLAAQRDPGLAERAVAETVLTNVVGTRNVLAAARHAGVPRVVHASTGKAVHYYAPDVYAASKKIAEWIVHAYATDSVEVAGVRFTHVVDNALLLDRFASWRVDGVARLHDPDIGFYVQSAAESAELLLAAGLESAAGRLRLFAIRDLGQPVSLLALTLRAMRECPDPAIYFTGYEPGYRQSAFPGLFDPHTAGDISPMINAVEAVSVAESEVAPQVDRFRLDLGAQAPPQWMLHQLAQACATGDDAAIRDSLDRLSWALTDATFGPADPALLDRLAVLTARHGERLPAEHRAQYARLRPVLDCSAPATAGARRVRPALQAGA